MRECCEAIIGSELSPSNLNGGFGVKRTLSRGVMILTREGLRGERATNMFQRRDLKLCNFESDPQEISTVPLRTRKTGYEFFHPAAKHESSGLQFKPANLWN